MSEKTKGLVMSGIKNRVASEAVNGAKKSEDNADVIRQ